MGTARVKQEEETDTRIIEKHGLETWKKMIVDRKEKSPKQGLTSANDPQGTIYTIYQGYIYTI